MLEENLNQCKNDRSYLMRCIIEICDTFEEEVGRKPSVYEFFELLEISAKGVNGTLFSDISPQQIKSIRTVMEESNEQVLDISISELNDNLFVIVSDILVNSVNMIKRDSGLFPRSDYYFNLIFQEIKDSDSYLFRSLNKEKFKAIKVLKNKKMLKAVRVGDIVAVPYKDDLHHIVCVLGKNRIGTSFGIFKGVYSLKELSLEELLPTKPLPNYIHSGDDFIRNGRWAVVGNRIDCVSLFPSELEVFHPPRKKTSNKLLRNAQYGLAENIHTGQIRMLNKQESEILRLYEKTFRQSYLEEEFENFLNKKIESS